MSRRKIRVGIFSRRTSPSEGGADTLLTTLAEKLAALPLGASIELVEIPWQAWSQRSNPLRYLGVRVARRLGVDLPDVNLRSVCRRLRLDIAYFTVPAFVQIDIPFIFTLWDIGHRTIPEFPEMRSGRLPWLQREALCRRMLAQASYVVVGNQTGAKEAREFFGLSADRVIAIPFPNPDFGPVDAASPSWLPTRPYFLFPAQFWPHKNHVTLLRALAHFATTGREVPDLIFVGSDQGNSAFVKSTAVELGVAERVHFPGFVSRGDLKALYQKAVALVFPSLLGPNNLPPQEAAVLGCPVIVSDLPGHREQMKEGAIYVAPLDEKGWAEAMHQVMSNPALRLSLVAGANAAVADLTVQAYTNRIGQLVVQLANHRTLWGN